MSDDQIIDKLPDFDKGEMLCALKCSRLHYCCWEYKDDICTCTIFEGLGNLSCRWCKTKIGPPLDHIPPQPSVV